MNRLLCVWVVFGSIACSNPTLDRVQFEAVDRAGQSLRLDVNTNEGLGSSRFPELLEQFHAEIAALDGRTTGRSEAAALGAYAAASESYGYLLRFQRLDRDAVGGMVLLTGSNRPVASRYGLPMETRGGGRWVNRRTAMKMFAEQAEAELSNANRLLSGR
jgi:hypothetical protein